MGRIWLSTAVLAAMMVSTARADSVEGLLAAVDPDMRTITLQTGEMFNLLETVSVAGLETGQLVRVTYATESIDADAIDILEPQIVTVADETEVADIKVVQDDPIIDISGSSDNQDTETVPE